MDWASGIGEERKGGEDGDSEVQEREVVQR